MPAVTVRSTSVFESVSTQDDDWVDTVRGWALSDPTASPKSVDAFMLTLIAQVSSQPIKPYFLKMPDGLQVVLPADFLIGFDDIADTDVLEEIYHERMTHGERGYTAVHDDAQSLMHFQAQVIDHLNKARGTVAEPHPTDAHIRHELIVAGSLIVAAVDKLDRAYQVKTFSVE